MHHEIVLAVTLSKETPRNRSGGIERKHEAEAEAEAEAGVPSSKCGGPGLRRTRYGNLHVEITLFYLSRN